MKYLITFDSVHQAMKTEDILINEEIKCRTIPTPREITTSCGLSIIFEEEYIDKFNSLDSKKDKYIKNIYKFYDKGDNKKIEKII